MSTHASQVAQETPRTAAQQYGRAGEMAIQPLADIYEDDEGITVEADMPGVAKERLNVHVDGDSLLLEGSVQFDLPEQAEALHADIRTTLYRRSFTLSRELETDKIQANLKDGVLTVRIPKRAALRPRKIEVQSD
jgi:HSP20 family protein